MPHPVRHPHSRCRLQQPGPCPNTRRMQSLKQVLRVSSTGGCSSRNAHPREGRWHKAQAGAADDHARQAVDRDELLGNGGCHIEPVLGPFLPRWQATVLRWAWWAPRPIRRGPLPTHCPGAPPCTGRPGPRQRQSGCRCDPMVAAAEAAMHAFAAGVQTAVQHIAGALTLIQLKSVINHTPAFCTGVAPLLPSMKNAAWAPA